MNFSSTYLDDSFICLESSSMCLVCSSKRWSTVWKIPVSNTLGSLAIMSVIWLILSSSYAWLIFTLCNMFDVSRILFCIGPSTSWIICLTLVSISNHSNYFILNLEFWAIGNKINNKNIITYRLFLMHYQLFGSKGCKII